MEVGRFVVICVSVLKVQLPHLILGFVADGLDGVDIPAGAGEAVGGCEAGSAD